MDPVFSEGTEVEVIRPGDGHYGMIGEITHVEPDGLDAEYAVTFDEDDGYFYTADDLIGAY